MGSEADGLGSLPHAMGGHQFNSDTRNPYERITQDCVNAIDSGISRASLTLGQMLVDVPTGSHEQGLTHELLGQIREMRYLSAAVRKTLAALSHEYKQRAPQGG